MVLYAQITINPGFFLMLRIGKMTDYAILIMSQMAKTPEAILSATSLAEALHLTSSTVSKILKMLAEAGLVNSVRGAEGGYLLSKPAVDISVAAIIVAMEGDVALTECCENGGLCTIDSLCALRENWQKINRMVSDMLSRLTIVDMLQPLSQGLLNGK
jgi:FeS assembly SUF system regulator